ncbi:hypothetical protein GCM10023082_46700 [Streptomyces tremellae]|uniref:Uncharacterized protein n=1 Tax=Streptomyces tremellae TaxID=1124239 RepID=A0ABP7FSA2_9ACTN
MTGAALDGAAPPVAGTGEDASGLPRPCFPPRVPQGAAVRDPGHGRGHGTPDGHPVALPPG